MKKSVELTTYAWEGARASTFNEGWTSYEFINKRLAHHLNLPVENRQAVLLEGGAAALRGAVYLMGLPLRSERFRMRFRVEDGPLVLVLRSTDAFGEVAMVLDLDQGTAKAWSHTVNRSMWGGQSHSSPMPEESPQELLVETTFKPKRIKASEWHDLETLALDDHLTVTLDGKQILEFDDPDMAAGRPGVGGPGTVYVQSVEQSEFITPAEKEAREEAVREMCELAASLDAEHEADVRAANEVTVEGKKVTWRYPKTGATVTLEPRKGGLDGKVTSGLYGDRVLLEGTFAEVVLRDKNGGYYTPNKDAAPQIKADDLGITIVWPLTSEDGVMSEAIVRIGFTIHTTWWWDVDVSPHLDASLTQIFFGVPDHFAGEGGKKDGTVPHLVEKEPASTLLRTDDVVGFYMSTRTDAGVVFGNRTGTGAGKSSSLKAKQIGASAHNRCMKFVTQWLPYQPCNKTGFGSRMVHFIKYGEGPVQHLREEPSPQVYPTAAEIERYARYGTAATVWHHTWTSNNYRERDGFIVNHREMKRAAEHSHRRGIQVLPYIGIVPGRNPLLPYETLGTHFEKNWDLCDFTCYKVGSIWSEFFPWFTDRMCREYGIDGYYIDGGMGALAGDIRDALTLDQQNYRLYYRVKKVFERNGAEYGLQCWGGGSIGVQNPFYDCRMIGESFTRAEPETYRTKYNALLTGTPFKMYAQNWECQDGYNRCMAAINLSDLQVCSGNGAWGNDLDDEYAWKRCYPVWEVLNTIDWDRVTVAMPWWAQKLAEGEGIYAAHYTEPDKVLLWVCNRGEKKKTVEVRINKSELPGAKGKWTITQLYPEKGQAKDLGDGVLKLELPGIEEDPLGFELRVK